MRRQVGIPKKASAIIALLLSGAISLTSADVAARATIPPAQPAAAPAQAQVSRPEPQNQEVEAEQQMSAQAPVGGTEPEPRLQTKESKPEEGQHVRQIVISITDRKLALLEDGEVLRIYPVAVGARWTPSPEGDFTVINHAKDPTYRHKGKVIEPGKDNPLGTRWMGLSLKGYGIHGTNVQGSVGKAISHGCFRMRKQDVEELYGLVEVGDTVSIRGERDGLVSQIFNPDAASVVANADMQAAAVNAQPAASGK